jgi:DNA end-binding protein Ku
MSASDEFHPENYRDEVQERIRGVIQRKVEGEEVTITAEEEPQAQVIDLMEALRRSLGSASSAPARPTRGNGSTTASSSSSSKPTRIPVKPEAKRKPAKPAPATRSAKTVTASRRAR